MSVDCKIINGKVVTSAGVYEAAVAIDDGKIVCIGRDSSLPAADRTIDAAGNLILPGVIDSHTHMRDPGQTHQEDFETGTRAAAAGGVTTVMDHGLSIPFVVNTKIFQDKVKIAKERVLVDFALHACITGAVNEDKPEEWISLAQAGAISFKMYLPVHQGGVIPPEWSFSDAASIYRAFNVTHKIGRPATIHAEDASLVEYLTKRMQQSGRKDPLADSEGRPNIVEAEAVSTIIELSKATGARVHFVHLTTKEGVDHIRQAKAQGQHQITVETCPHYLLVEAKDMEKVGGWGKIKPPLRSREDMDALWTGINDNTIDTIGTDHSPRLTEDKELGWQDIWKAPNGISGVETLLPLMLTQVNNGRLSLTRLVELTSEKPAKIFGVYPRKGVIQTGSDADLVIVDLKKDWTIHKENLHYKVRASLFDGWKVKGCPLLTMVRGEIVMRENEILGKPGYGQFIKPEET